VDWLKDEKRKIEKLYKTRYFNIHNVVWLIIHKRLFGAAAAAWLWAKFEVGSGLGFNMHGADVTELIKKLKSKGSKFIHGDVGGWDGNLDSDVIHDGIWVLNSWVNLFEKQTNQQQAARFWIMREMSGFEVTCRVHVVGNTVYLVFQGMPSGWFLTAVINTITHKLLSFMNFLEIVEGLTPKLVLDDYEDLIAEIKVGDDSGGAVSDDIVELYNDKTIASVFGKYGTECTPPTKRKDEPFPPFVEQEDFSFLKCRFKRDADYPNYFHALMDRSVIFELTNWIHKSESDWAMLQANLEDMKRFAYHHGEEFYNFVIERVNVELVQLHKAPLSTNFETLNQEWLENYDN